MMNTITVEAPSVAAFAHALAAGTYVADWTPETPLQQRMALGHWMRTGHAQTGYYVTTDHPGIVRLVRTCGCEEA